MRSVYQSCSPGAPLFGTLVLCDSIRCVLLAIHTAARSVGFFISLIFGTRDFSNVLGVCSTPFVLLAFRFFMVGVVTGFSKRVLSIFVSAFVPWYCGLF